MHQATDIAYYAFHINYAGIMHELFTEILRNKTILNIIKKNQNRSKRFHVTKTMKSLGP